MNRFYVDIWKWVKSINSKEKHGNQSIVRFMIEK